MKRIAIFSTAALLWLSSMGIALCYAQQAANTVYLDQSRSWRVRAWDKTERGQLLCRELIRQAFLIAARDELGLETRDAWLGDGMPTEGDNAPWDIVSKAGKSSSVVELVRGFAAKQTSFVREEFSSELSGSTCGWATQAEELSRTKFIDALKRAGFQGKPHKLDESLGVPAEVETLLQEMNPFSQFRALRELHELTRTKGESAAILGGLARGYATLGLLTDQYWHPLHKVLKARAMLYARRMVHRTLQSPVGLWHRAYVAALAGDHRWALDDLETAKKKSADSGAGPRPTEPPWVPVIAQFCRFEIDKLGQQLNDPKVGELAALLRFLDVAPEAPGDEWLLRYVTETLKTIPQCYRVSDASFFLMPSESSYSQFRSAENESLKSLGKVLYLQLDSMNGLPEQVRRIVDVRIPGRRALANLLALDSPKLSTELKVRKPLADALIETGQWHRDPRGVSAERDADRGEPSWAALGTLLRELNFFQIVIYMSFRSVDVSRDPAVPDVVLVDNWIKKADPLTGDHPFHVYVDTWRDVSIAEKALAQLAKVDPTGAVCQTLPGCWVLAFENMGAYHRWWQEIDRNWDLLTGDFYPFICLLGQQNDAWIASRARCLLYVSPHSPLARETLLVYDWPAVQNSALDWEKDATHFPHLLSLLGRRFAQSGRWDAAERCLKAALKLVPSNSSYHTDLAELYKKQGKIDLWVATVEKYLKGPNDEHAEEMTLQGLEPALALMDIAHYYMREKHWDKALTYAQRAAHVDTGHVRFIRCLGECYEGAQRWSEAEERYRAYAQRPFLGLHWYFFCRRTGQGDFKAARAFARSVMDTPGDKTESFETLDLNTYYLLEGEPEKAVSVMKKVAPNATKDVLGWLRGDAALWQALIADQLNDPKMRDEALATARKQEVRHWESETSREARKVRVTSKAKGNGVLVLIDAITKDLAQGGKGNIDFTAIDKLIADVGDDEPLVCYCLGHYLNIHGQRQAAERYWRRVMDWREPSDNYCTLAAVALAEHGAKAPPQDRAKPTSALPQ